jgi:predicted nucleic acid-binding protein
MIASMALARRAELATHNVKHFDDVGIEVLNPSHG